MTPEEVAAPQTDTELSQSDHSFAEELVQKVITESTPRERDAATGRFVGEKADTQQSEAAPEGEAEEAAPEETPTSGEQGESEGEPAEPIIDPPPSWTAEAKEVFSKLPPDLQRYVTDRESERDNGLKRQLAELAEARKKVDPELTAITQERQRLAELLGQVQQYAMLANPALAEGMKTDWVKLAKEDPATYTARWAEYQQAATVMQAMQVEQQRLAQLNQQKAFADYKAKVTETFPDYADPIKGDAMVKKWAPLLLANGFSQDEVSATRNVMWDPRHLKVFDMLVDKAAELDKRVAAEKSVREKKAAIQAAPINRPKANSAPSKPQESARVVALKKQADKSGSDRDFAAYLAAKHAEEKRP